MGDAQFANMVQPGGKAGFGGGAFLCQPQEFSLGINAGGGIGGEIPDVKLVYHVIGIAGGFYGACVPAPALRVGVPEVQNHSTLPVHAGGNGIGVDGFNGISVYTGPVGIVEAVPVALGTGGPCAGLALGHGDGCYKVVGAPGAAAVQADGCTCGGGSPHAECGLVLFPAVAQVLSGVCIFFLKSRGAVF